MGTALAVVAPQVHQALAVPGARAVHGMHALVICTRALLYLCGVATDLIGTVGIRGHKGFLWMGVGALPPGFCVQDL
jgi:hypothetical protein